MLSYYRALSITSGHSDFHQMPLKTARWFVNLTNEIRDLAYLVTVASYVDCFTIVMTD